MIIALRGQDSKTKEVAMERVFACYLQRTERSTDSLDS